MAESRQGGASGEGTCEPAKPMRSVCTAMAASRSSSRAASSAAEEGGERVVADVVVPVVVAELTVPQTDTVVVTVVRVAVVVATRGSNWQLLAPRLCVALQWSQARRAALCCHFGVGAWFRWHGTSCSKQNVIAGAKRYCWCGLGEQLPAR